MCVYVGQPVYNIMYRIHLYESGRSSFNILIIFSV